MPTRTRFDDVGNGIGEMVEQLTGGRIAGGSYCHLDPDLHSPMLPRRTGWRGALGQVAAAQGHLRKSGVTTGDLFLFWGLFRPATRDEFWRFEERAEHRLFGWLQVDAVVDVGSKPAATLARRPWLADHPHLQGSWPASNTIYIARENLRLDGVDSIWPGWGICRKGLRLTASGADRISLWHVPDWLNPKRGGVGMTYHPLSRWNDDGTVIAASRGQEFVADIAGRRDAIDWLRRLFEAEA